MDYKVGSDLSLTRFLLNISQEELAREISIERITLLRIENNETNPSLKTLDQIYSYIYEKGININQIKADFFDEEMITGTLLLHGSKSEIQGDISPFVGRKSSDFGQAFYAGESVEQTTSFVTNFENSCLYILEFNEKGLKRYDFDVNQEWMLAVAYFRGTLEKYKNHPKIQNIVNIVKSADYVVAPIADNRMFRIIDQFIEGLITDEQCQHCLAATHLGKQYAFLTTKATSQIKILDRCFISSKERKEKRKIKEHDGELSENKVKEAMRSFRNKGKYIEDILDETN